MLLNQSILVEIEDQKIVENFVLFCCKEILIFIVDFKLVGEVAEMPLP